MNHWTLNPDITFLNHGSYGATPKAILQHQDALRAMMENEPVNFMLHHYPELIQDCRLKLAAHLEADPQGLALTVNATAAFNAVLRSLDFKAGDKIVSTSFAYPAIANTLDFIAKRDKLNLSIIQCPIDKTHRDLKQHLLLSLEKELQSGCRLVAMDHITSATAIRLPVEEIIALAHHYKTPVIIDGAHVPGMLPLSINTLGADFYIGNCHKWLCSPKGAGFLWLSAPFRDEVVPTAISNGYSLITQERTRYQQLFDWTGTFDPSAQLTVPFVLSYMSSLRVGGWSNIMAYNAQQCMTAARDIQTQLDLVVVESDVPLAMASFIIPKSRVKSSALSGLPTIQAVATALHPLQLALFNHYQIQVPVMERSDHLLLRISHQLYNNPQDYQRLSYALKDFLT